MVLQKGEEKEERFVLDIIQISEWGPFYGEHKGALWQPSEEGNRECVILKQHLLLQTELPHYVWTNTWEQIPEKMIHDRFSHFILIRMVKEREELSVRRFRCGVWWQRLTGENTFISEERRVLLFLSHTLTDSTRSVTIICKRHPPTHTHWSLSANYPACNEGVKLVVTQKHHEKQKGAGSLVKRS